MGEILSYLPIQENEFGPESKNGKFPLVDRGLSREVLPLPDEDPRLLGKALDALTEDAEFEALEVQSVDVSSLDVRPGYDHVLFGSNGFSKEQEQLSIPRAKEVIRKAQVYNSVRMTNPDGTESEFNANLLSDRNRQFQEEIVAELRSGRYVVITPFHREPNTMGEVGQYVVSRVGRENALAVSTGVDPRSEELATDTRIRWIRQDEVLRAIKWKELVEAGFLPARALDPKTGLIRGSKGITMYSGMLPLEKSGLLDEERVVAFHDTDITNPGSKNGHHSTTGQYGALEHLAFPYLMNPHGTQIRSSMMLRTGEGRNNEPWQQSANVLNIHLNPQHIRKLGVLMGGGIGWPLSGERTFSGNTTLIDGSAIPTARAIPFATGMSIETVINISLSGMDAEDGLRSVAQIASHKDNPKIEDRPSPRSREYDIVNGCGVLMQYYVKAIEKAGGPLHHWFAEDIALYNNKLGGRRIEVAVPADGDNHNSILVSKYIDYMMPPLHMFHSELSDYIDWDQVPSWDQIKSSGN